MGPFNLTEMLVVAVLAVIILGPERLPEYAAKLGRGVRQLKAMATGAREAVREEVGDAFDDIAWDQLDPRRYDPRRIVREALSEEDAEALLGPDEDSVAALEDGDARKEGPPAYAASASRPAYQPGLPTPFDPDAT